MRRGAEISSAPMALPPGAELRFPQRRDDAPRLAPDEALHELGRQRLDTLRSAAKTAAAVTRAISDERRSAIDRRTDLRGRIEELESWSAGNVGAEIAAVEQQLAKVAADITAADERLARASAAQQPLAELVRRVESYVSTLTPAQLALPPHEGEAVRLKKGQGAVEAIVHVRRTLRGLQADRVAALAAPVPSSVARAKMAREVEALAARGAVDCYGLIEQQRGGEISWPMTPISIGEPGGSEIVDTLGLLCWLHRAEIIKRLDAEIGEVSDDKLALSDEQRADRLQQIADDLLHAERQEEALVLAAEQDGLTIARRPDCDPRAILQLADSLPPPRAED